MEKKYPKIEIINVGSELLLHKLNTDILLISDILLKSGLRVSKCIIVGDKKDEIKKAIENSLVESEILIITGGLGPTFDDLTREAISDVLNRKLIFSNYIWEKIKERFQKIGRDLPEINKKQSYIIDGCEIIENEVGTAPGMFIEENNKIIIVLPGPPNELGPMLENTIEKIKNKFSSIENVKIAKFSVCGVPESVVEEKMRDIIEREKSEHIILAHPDLIELLFIFDLSIYQEKTEEIDKIFKERFGENYLGINPPALPEIIGKILKEKKLKLAIAESCSGGLACKLITDIPGSSEYFTGGFVTYSNTLKKRILRVPKCALKKYGAVSEEVAICMAKGAKKYGKSDISLSFTGIAGPTGGSKEKPVGLVWIGVGLPKNKNFAQKFIFNGNRATIRERAVRTGLNILRKEIMKL
ncbi:MAG TPA: competence/damage-inducible protein A [bacterium]|nr:competence/damage-inducible protein A [bacterium]